MATKPRKTVKKRRRPPIAALFWLVFVLFTAVIFLVTRHDIERVLQSTQLLEVIRARLSAADTGTGADGVPPRARPATTAAPPVVTVERPTDAAQPGTARSTVTTQPAAPAAVQPAAERSAVTPNPAAATGDSRPPQAPAMEPLPTESAAAGSAAIGATGDAATGSAATGSGATAATRTAVLYFIKVTETGAILLEPVTREVAAGNSPLTASIQNLINGPSYDELSAGLLNLIPQGTVLLSAGVRSGIAYLSFNDAFRFNPLGVEGYLAQLKQVVFVATEFASVERVQFLIEGQAVEYLGGDGVYIGNPLSRASFS